MSADAEEVAPHTLLPAAAYLAPALRANASAATVAGRPYPRLAAMAVAVPAAHPAPYTLPQRRTAEQQAAVEAAGRPGRPCPYPLLVAGPQLPAVAAAPAAARPSILLACQG